jgi:hypothetical protein
MMIRPVVDLAGPGRRQRPLLHRRVTSGRVKELSANVCVVSCEFFVVAPSEAFIEYRVSYVVLGIDHHFPPVPYC